jgi:hypothetical protein
MNSVGDALGAPFQDPGWLGKVLVQGLILLIPILGGIALYGWMMMTIDNYKSGRRELAPAGFHLGRGLPLFVVGLVYAVICYIPVIIFAILAGSTNSSGLAAIGNLLTLVLLLGLLFLAPSIITATYRGGIGAGLNFAAVLQMATANPTNSLLAALMLLVAGIIADLGLILCIIGVIFTEALAAAVIAGVVVWFDQVSSGGGMTPALAGGYPQPGYPAPGSEPAPPPAPYQAPPPPPYQAPPPPPPQAPPPAPYQPPAPPSAPDPPPAPPSAPYQPPAPPSAPYQPPAPPPAPYQPPPPPYQPPPPPPPGSGPPPPPPPQSPPPPPPSSSG